MNEKILQMKSEQPAAAPAPHEPTPRRLSMSIVNFSLDALLLGLLTLYGWETAVLRFVFPAPTLADDWKLWGWTFDQWWDVQFTTLCVFAVAALVHVMLHWNWVCGVLANQILKLKGRTNNAMRTIYGVGLLVVLLHLIAIGLIAAMAGVIRPPQ